MLDRLLDEADALRNAEAAPCGDPEAPSSSPEVDRKPGVLHQRADAVRRAFNRADALVSIAQGYLRGDRPNRAPIEVTLVVADGLR